MLFTRKALEHLSRFEARDIYIFWGKVKGKIALRSPLHRSITLANEPYLLHVMAVFTLSMDICSFPLVNLLMKSVESLYVCFEYNQIIMCHHLHNLTW